MISDSNSKTGITYQHPTAFWLGTAAVAIGVVAHMPDFMNAAGMKYRMSGMPMTPLMLGGMIAILVGLALAAYGLVPFGKTEKKGEGLPTGMHLQAMDSATLTPAHWGLLFILGVALVVDVMKPATLGFVVPGMKAEYGYTTKQIAMFPLTALAGTTLGSIMWGVLADRIGRRAAILLASVLFMGTSICGFMPSYNWNLVMCFIMGISAGGMLPIVYSLMAESIPAKKRGWLVVLHGGLGTAGGYLAAAGLATLLEPHYSWRILWFAGLPTGLLVLVLNRWIPESPRFLLERGRVDEAEDVMRRYGITLARRPETAIEAATPVTTAPRGSRLASLMRPPYLSKSLTVLVYGLAWGLVNWGFLTFIPTILRERGLPAASASKALFFSALIAVPGTLLVSYLYGYWSSKKTMITFALITAGALIAFALIDPGANGQNIQWLKPLMVLLLIGSGGVISMLSPYTAEVYPTHMRGTGSGFAAGSSKIGGIIAPPTVAIILGIVPGFAALGFVVAAPMLLASAVLALGGIETRDRGLEDLAHATAGSREDKTPVLT